MPYWRAYQHLIWATSGRRRLLTGERSRIAEAAIRTKARELQCLVHGVAVQPDHVHVAVSIPPKHSPAKVVGQMKGASSFLLRERDPALVELAFGWQHEYGLVTFSDSGLAAILDYLANQNARHTEARLLDLLERVDEPALDERTPHRF